MAELLLRAGATPRTVGRARLIPSQREGMTAREEILDAAGQLFARQGYAPTTTRSIAREVGIKQASLYYHFASKEDILAGLLEDSVQPSLAYSVHLSRRHQPPHVQLYALSLFDITLLAGGSSNVGALYHLPEIRGDRFTPFRRDRERLRRAYGRRIAAGIDAGLFRPRTSLRVATDLVFALAESVVSVRERRRTWADAVPATAAGCLRILSCPEGEIARAASLAAELP